MAQNLPAQELESKRPVFKPSTVSYCDPEQVPQFLLISSMTQEKGRVIGDPDGLRNMDSQLPLPLTLLGVVPTTDQTGSFCPATGDINAENLPKDSRKYLLQALTGLYNPPPSRMN